MQQPSTDPKINPPARQLTYQDAMYRSRGGAPAPSNGSGRGLDMRDIGDRLASALEFATVAKTVKDLESGGGSNNTQQIAPIDLAALITAVSDTRKSGSDDNAPMIALLNYMQETDKGAIQREVAELRHEMAGGGPSTLETLQILKEMDMLGDKGSKEGEMGQMLQMITVLKEIGVIGKEPTPQPSMLSQVTEALALVKAITPVPAPAPPQTTIQFPGGGSFSLQDYITFDEHRDRKQARLDEADLKREQIKVTRDIIGTIAESVTEAAAALRLGETNNNEGNSNPRVRRENQTDEPSNESTPTIVQREAAQPQRPSGTVRTMNCDYCDAPNEIDLAGAPDDFTCSTCEEKNIITYADN